MDKQEKGVVAGVAGLIGVRSDRYYYVGKLDPEGMATRVRFPVNNDGGYVALKDAYEILVQHTPTQEGMKMAIMPTYIAPFGGPTRVVVRVDAYFDLSGEAEFVNIDRAMTGRSGLVLPGSALPPRR